MQPKPAIPGQAATPARAPALADLRAFTTAAELRSFAAAAKLLHLSLPAFSRRISNLEARLGVRLFDRTTRSVELTVLGARFGQQAFLPQRFRPPRPQCLPRQQLAETQPEPQPRLDRSSQ